MNNRYFNIMKVFLTTGFLCGFSGVVVGDGAVSSYALLTDGAGNGFCTVEQKGKQVWAKINVNGFTATSTGTAWVKFDGQTVRRLAGTVSDASGQALLEGHFTVKEGVTDISFDVRDHERDINDILDDDDLNTELTNFGSNTTPSISTKMGVCTFINQR